MADPQNNPKSLLNNYCMRYQCKPEWIENPNGLDKSMLKTWTYLLRVPTPDGPCIEALGTAGNKKQAEQIAAAQVMVTLRDRGLLKDVKGAGGEIDLPAKTSNSKNKREPAEPKEPTEPTDQQEPAEPRKPRDLKELKPPTAPPNARVALNNFCMKSKAKCEWHDSTRGTPGAGGNWRMKLKLTVPEGPVVETEGAAGSKKEAEMIAADSCMSQLRSLGLVEGIEVDYASPGPGNGGAPPAKRARTAPAADGSPNGAPMEPAVPEDIGETFGYTLAVARAQLNQYLQKRRMPVDIPVEGIGPGGTSPFRASLEVPIRGDAPLRMSWVCSKKQDAANQLALRLCVELCKAGELPPFQTKAQAMEEGLTPCMMQVSPEVEQRLDAVLAELGVDTGKGQLPTDQDIQMDFDASGWSGNPNQFGQISWEPPTWGISPWIWEDVHGPRPCQTDEFVEREVQAALSLATDQETKHASREYHETMRKRKQLPVSAVAQDILCAIEKYPVTLISGSTGCGKTTQVPQLLLENAIANGEATKMNMVCTQPRRIAAITVAERVAAERHERLGQSVGYCVRFNSVMPRGFASCCYMTTGMLLRRMSSYGLRGVSHVIIDEVHERDLDTDFLLIVVREIVRQCADLGPKGLKIILMSATINIAKWASYFGRELFTALEIPGRLFPVAVHYLEDAMRLANISGEVLRQSKPQDDIPMDMAEQLVVFLVAVSLKADRGAILFFLPGWDAITSIEKRIRRNASIADRVRLHLLHSQVPKEEQQAAFDPAPEGLVKVILSTNIAESSVTISDVVYVIDSCRVKQLVAMQSSSGRTAYRLTSAPASKENLQQRAGRAGRVREGMCFRLVSRSQYARLPENLEPEMVRIPLHQVTLMLKSLNLGYAAQFLALAPDPPPQESVAVAVAILKDLKALDGNEDITVLGQQLSKLPVEPRMAFALLASCVFGLGEPMAILCALASAPSLYLNETRRGKELNNCDTQSQQLLSDHHDWLLIYYSLRRLGPEQAMRECARRFLNFKVFFQVRDAAEQTVGILKRMGFAETALGSCEDWLWQMGTQYETNVHRMNWAALAFVLGFGLDHFCVRKGLSRKVWVGATKTSQVSASPGIPEVPPQDPLRPFFIYAEQQETQWSSSCRGVTAVNVSVAVLSSARELVYDHDRGCVLLDGWAPVKLNFQTAARMGAVRAALRLCMLALAKEPSIRREGDPNIALFVQLLAELCNPSPSTAGISASELCNPSPPMAGFA